MRRRKQAKHSRNFPAPTLFFTYRVQPNAVAVTRILILLVMHLVEPLITENAPRTASILLPNHHSSHHLPPFPLPTPVGLHPPVNPKSSTLETLPRLTLRHTHSLHLSVTDFQPPHCLNGVQQDPVREDPSRLYKTSIKIKIKPIARSSCATATAIPYSKLLCKSAAEINK